MAGALIVTLLCDITYCGHCLLFAARRNRPHFSTLLCKDLRFFQIQLPARRISRQSFFAFTYIYSALIFTAGTWTVSTFAVVSISTVSALTSPASLTSPSATILTTPPSVSTFVAIHMTFQIYGFSKSPGRALCFQNYGLRFQGACILYLVKDFIALEVCDFLACFSRIATEIRLLPEISSFTALPAARLLCRPLR